MPVNSGQCYPLIFVDGQMPDMDGFTLTAITKPIRPTGLFAAIESVMANKAVPAGMADHSRK